MPRVGPDREKRECCAWSTCTSAKIKFDVKVQYKRCLLGKYNNNGYV